MCLVALAWQAHPRFPLVLAANRDEFHARPSAAMQWWSDGHILAGQDLQAGGTWLGLSRHARLGVLTNVREPGRHQDGLASRGHFIPWWLDPEHDAQTLADRLAQTPANGYNLLGLDLARGEAHCWSNRHGHRALLQAGLYGLSNAALDTPWPKLLRLKQHLQDRLTLDEPSALVERLLAALADRHQPDDTQLPQTGVPIDWERWLSRIFIETPDRRYGTRCSTVVVAERRASGGFRLHVAEQSWDAQGHATTQVRHEVETGSAN